MSGIFISYRRDDSAGHAGRLYDRLKLEFPDTDIFIDVDRIAAGDDFVATTERILRRCDVCLAVIGKRWLTAADEYGKRRLDKSNDWVRTEIGAALTRNIRVIPLLVDNASQPVAAALPGELTRLESLQAHPINHLTFHQDVDRLVQRIREAMGRRKAAQEMRHRPGEKRVHPQDGLEYVWVPPGDFMMGRVPGDDVGEQQYAVERPRHPVRLTSGFWMSRGPVIVRAYQYFAQIRRLDMPRAPNYNPNWTNLDHPIANVNWMQAREYCAWVGGRLPTEAQWEYAGRGGLDGAIYPWGSERRPDMANYAENPRWGDKSTSPVGSFPENGFGLVDMVGNVWQWVSDWYDEQAYSRRAANEPTVDPEGLLNPQDQRVVRGGSWRSIAKEIRLSLRGFQTPAGSYSDFGFRCIIDEMPDP
jgi:formylglycine-generating enzyme required for sulfatase activity